MSQYKEDTGKPSVCHPGEFNLIP